MTIPGYKLFLILLAISIFLFAPSGYAKEEKDQKTETEEVEPVCKKRKLKSRGRPNRIQIMASMSAIVSWIKRANKAYGTEFGDWHRAQTSKTKCNKIAGSDYYICMAEGKPCKKSNKETTPTKN